MERCRQTEILWKWSRQSERELVVLSVKPLTIKMHNTTITKNLYINPALMLNASDSGEDIKKPFITPFEPQEAYEFLKEFHEKYVLKKGDTVVVHITGSSFYIAGKAVKA